MSLYQVSNHTLPLQEKKTATAIKKSAVRLWSCPFFIFIYFFILLYQPLRLPGFDLKQVVLLENMELRFNVTYVTA